MAIPTCLLIPVTCVHTLLFFLPFFQGQSEEGVWLIQVLREQIELLEIILLYYKDFDFLAPDLCQAAKRFQVTILYPPCMIIHT